MQGLNEQLRGIWLLELEDEYKMIKRALLGLLVIGSLFVGNRAAEADSCSVYITDYEGDAHFLVYITEYAEKNAQLIQGCRLTKYYGEATYRIALTSYEMKAKILINRKNFPKP